MSTRVVHSATNLSTIPLAQLLSKAQLADLYEDLVEGVRDEVFNLQFRKTELQDRNLNPATAWLRNVGLSGNGLLKTVDRTDSRNPSRWTVNSHVDSYDGVAIGIDLCELIKDRSVKDGFRVVGCNCLYRIIHVRPSWTRLLSLELHMPKHFHLQMNARCIEG